MLDHAVEHVKLNSVALFPEDDYVRGVEQSQLDLALELIEAPPASASASFGDATSLSLALLEYAHAQGQTARQHLATKARGIGNLYFEKMTAAKTQAQKLKFKEDCLVEWAVARQDMSQTTTVCANLAAMWWQLKE